MWTSLTSEQKKEIATIVKYFQPKFPDIEYNILYERVDGGYCYGEGGIHLRTIEDWNRVFFGEKGDKSCFTVFDDWDDYFKYEKDWHKKWNSLPKEERPDRIILVPIDLGDCPPRSWIKKFRVYWVFFRWHMQLDYLCRKIIGLRG